MIRNIWAVGRNYLEHAKELNNPVPSEPMIFLKAGSSATLGNPNIQLPDWVEEVHHEIELALHFDKNLNIDQFALALDLTERKKQATLKEKGMPWTLAKSFTGSCPISSPCPLNSLDELKNLNIELKINSVIKQTGNINQMIFSIEELITYVKFHFPVCEGDWLLTGTPSGVGKINKGDTLEASLGNKLYMKWKII